MMANTAICLVEVSRALQRVKLVDAHFARCNMRSRDERGAWEKKKNSEVAGEKRTSGLPKQGGPKKETKKEF